MSNLFIVPIEPIETRYTKHWYTYLPEQLSKFTSFDGVIQLNVDVPEQETSPGAFLNFLGTVDYKSRQIQEMAKLFQNNLVHEGDVFLFADAWNPSVFFLRYMAGLSKININTAGIWHAGSYDPHDFLGRTFEYDMWVGMSEDAMYMAYDKNIFATEFHLKLFHRERHNVSGIDRDAICGFPMEYTTDLIKPGVKEDLVVFPGRIAPEKQLHVFKALEEVIKQVRPNYQFVVAQEVCKNKDEYHDLLSRAKVVFSSSLQETLGISIYEGLVAGAIPVVPNRLSYTEMYNRKFRYDRDRDAIRMIIEFVDNYEDYIDIIEFDKTLVSKLFFSGDVFYTLMDDLKG